MSMRYFSVWFLFCYIVSQKSKGQFSYLSPESAANHRKIEIEAEHRRYVFIFLKPCVYIVEFSGAMAERMWERSLPHHTDQGFLSRPWTPLPGLSSSHGTGKPRTAHCCGRSWHEEPRAPISHLFFWETGTSPTLPPLAWDLLLPETSLSHLLLGSQQGHRDASTASSPLLLLLGFWPGADKAEATWNISHQSKR